MHILLLDQFSEVGGAQLCLEDLLPAFRERGWRVHSAIPGNGPFAARMRSHGVDVQDIRCGPYRSGSKTAADLWNFAFDVVEQSQLLSRLLERFRFDLVYVNGPRLLPAVAVAVGSRVPVVFHAHNLITQKLAARLLGWSLRHCRPALIACSRFVAGPLRPHVVPERLHIIANGTPDFGFHERDFDSTRPLRIGVIGRIEPEKGQLDFLHAAGLLAAEFPQLRFVLCGASPQRMPDYHDEVRNLARALPVDFLGWREDIQTVFRGLDLLVIPSRHEGLPRVMLEAFSAGVPVVAFPAGGVEEAIEDNVTGFLVPEASRQALATRLCRLLRGDPGRLRAVARNARERWEQSYDVALYRRNILELIERLPRTSRVKAKGVNA
jgi:glycosyltransferase involved in cell wall biosynthesis